MAARTHIKRVRGRYFWRARIPTDLVGRIGRTELNRPLGTADPAVARRRAIHCSLFADGLFGFVRQDVGLDRERLNGLLLAFLRAPLERTDLALTLPVGGQSERVLTAPQPSEGVPARYTALGDPLNGKSLSDLAARFVHEHSAAWRSPKTRLDYEVAFRLAAEVIGNLPAPAVTREDARTLRDVLKALPPNFSRTPGKTVLELAEEPSAKRLSPKSVNKYLLSLSALFNWACREGFVPANPFEGLAVHDARRADEQRAAFTRADLGRILAAPLFTGCASMRDRFTAGAHVYWDYKFWMGPLSLFTGMRLGELLQLEVGDIQELEGIAVIRVTEEGGRALKTDAARRLVPIHPTLLRMGFLGFVQDAQGRGASDLFPDAPRGKDGYFSPPSKWYARFLHSVRLTDSRLTFHSYRHTFVNALKQAKVEDRIIEELVGHEGQSVTFNRYGKRYEVRVLYEAILRLDYGLDLSHLDVRG